MKAAWWIAALALLAPGCDTIKGLAEQAAQEAASSAAEQADDNDVPDDPDTQLSEKLDRYIDCVNRTSQSVIRAANRYYDWADKTKGPTGAERNVYGTYELSFVDECKKGIAEAKVMAPALAELEKAGADYKAALDAVAPLNKQAYDYYEQGNYKDDKMAKGKALHEPLVAAFDGFGKADDALRKAFEQHKVGLQQRQLERLKKDGHELAYRHQKVMLEAKALVKLADVESLDEVDLAAFQKQLDAADAALKEVDDYTAAHQEEAQRVMMFSLFASAAKEYLASCKALLRHKRDNKPFESIFLASSPEMVDGHPAQVLKRYNDMVDRSNALQWR